MQRARGINAGPACESMLPAGELVRGPWLRGRSKGRTRAGHAGEHTGHIAGNMHRPDLDKGRDCPPALAGRLRRDRA